ncbi:MAG: PRTRC system protein C [Pedobacter sp.]|nr:PRTRC system protein C [Pedobacter sp.]
MLIKEILKRVFIHNDNGSELKLIDPSADYTPEQVKHFYSGSYPILTNARVEGPEVKNDEIRFTFVTTLGTKG